jgi:hypothetical protein
MESGLAEVSLVAAAALLSIMSGRTRERFTVLVLF